MARFQEDEEDNAPVERPRRRPKKKPVTDDEDDAPRGRGGGGGGGDEDEEENSLSTGNIFLDIILDFRDDCIDWAREHMAVAIAIVVVAFLLFLGSIGLTVRYIVNYMNRPTLDLAVTAYDYGSYSEAKHLAEEVLKYAKPDDQHTRAGANFVLGAATCSIAEIAWNSNRQPYYLAAAGYLRLSEEYGFLPRRQAEGYFLLGKSLYLSGELTACRAPLERALELNAPDEKMIAWFLANSFFLDSQSDYPEALRWLRRFRKTRTVTEEERYEADLFQSIIHLRMNDVTAAEQAFQKVPEFDRFETMRHFVTGQIAFLKARENRKKAVELESRRDPLSAGDIPVAPVPVRPEETPKVDAEPSPDNEPQPDPFSNPETEKLLPTQPDSSVWPVFPVSPDDFTSPPPKDPWSSVTPPAPVEDENEATPIHKRLATMRSRTQSPYSRETPPAPESETRKVDPDAVIVMPTEPSRPAPMPTESSEEISPRAAPVNPVRAAADRFHELANDYYTEAIQNFREVRRRDTFVPHWTREAFLLEGMAREENGDYQKAQETWLSLSDAFPRSSEAVAARFLWAEVERKFGRTESAIRGFSQAFENLRENNPNYGCPWLTKDEMVRRCEDMVRAAIVLKDHRHALTLLHLSRGVMPDAERLRFRGEAYEDWAADLRRQSVGTFGARGDELLKESNEKYRRSAEAFEELARVDYASPELDDRLWRCAENYRYGRDFRRAIPAYRNFLRSNIKDHRPEVFLYLGEMYIHLDGIDEAASVLETAIEEYPNHALVPRMRFILSRAYYEQKKPDRAREMLQLNLVGEYAPSSSIYRDSLYALGKLYYEQGNWDEAIPCCETALKLHPNAVQAAETHYALARSYLRRSEAVVRSSEEAPLESVREKIRHDSLAEQEKALHHIQKSEELLAKRQQAIGLTEAERLMLRNTLFGAGTILMRLGMYEQAIPTLNIAATRYQDRPEAMDALLNLAVAQRHLNDRPEALATLNRAEVVLRQLEKSGTIPPENNWASLIEVQKNLVNLEEIHR